MTAIRLDGRLALVTGAAGGIGAATAQALAGAGARVWLADRDAARCEAVARALREQGHAAWAAALDVTEPAAVHALAQRVAAEQGDLDILVNNAGLLVRRGIDDPDAEAIVHQVMEVNLHGAFAMVKAFLPALRRRRGCIVNVASGAAFTAQARCAGYSASKAALHMLTQTLAVDLGADGVRVNAVAPGVIETAMTEATRADATRLAGFVQRTPAGRIGQPAEVAAAILFLASPLASYVNAATLPVDGGFLAT
ncbi:MAG: glucose 1-dehydrogenase [Burkholderiaceae bacterium]|nr:glucose 1-dehydrogenase [Burkholderiaceae bacterium]